MCRMILALCLAGVLWAQPAKFDVASVKASQAASDAVSGIRTGQGELDAHNVTLKRLIIGAYGIGPNQISGGPNWLDVDRFDILAKTEPSVNSDGALMMLLREVLVDRFQLKAERKTKSIQALVLEVTKKGPKMEKAEGGESSTNTTGGSGRVTIEARFTDMDRLAGSLARYTELPVVNRTGLKGMYNFRLQWTQRGELGPEDVTLFTAIQEQLGLVLRARKAPVEVLVIKRAERPTEN